MWDLGQKLKIYLYFYVNMSDGGDKSTTTLMVAAKSHTLSL